MDYWENEDFKEERVGLGGGYKKGWGVECLGIVAFGEEKWVGGKGYNGERGMDRDF